MQCNNNDDNENNNNHHNIKKIVWFFGFLYLIFLFFGFIVYSREEYQPVHLQFISLYKGEVTVKFERFNLAF